MGCDIHCYIEYCKKTGGTQWYSFGGHINPGRDYLTFAKLAGVRGDGALFAPRGMPICLSFASAYDDRLPVSATPRDGYVSAATAASWVIGAASKWIGDDHKYVSNPDHHSHSWLSPDEWEAAITAGNADLEYHAMLAAMRSIESDGNHLVRVVFWFDN